MAGSTPRQAASNFIAPIQRALSCITNAAIVTSGYSPEQKHALILNGGNPIEIQAGDKEMAVSVLQNYRIVESEDERGPWKVRTTKYAYALHDTNGSEIFSYHWHPEIGPRQPHVHVRATASSVLRKAHFPTGRVSLEQFIRVLIEDFKVRPRRDSWKKILQQAQEAFERWRTWN